MSLARSKLQCVKKTNIASFWGPLILLGSPMNKISSPLPNTLASTHYPTITNQVPIIPHIANLSFKKLQQFCVARLVWDTIIQLSLGWVLCKTQALPK